MTIYGHLLDTGSSAPTAIKVQQYNVFLKDVQVSPVDFLYIHIRSSHQEIL